VCPELPAPTLITLEQPPKYDERHELFDLPDEPVLWAPAPEDEATRSYRARAAPSVPDLSPRALTEHRNTVGHEFVNVKPVVDGATFVIPSCIERRLFARQAQRFDFIDHPTEYSAFIARGNGRAHVYFSSMDFVGGKIRHEVTDLVARDTTQGFRLVAHLHNHTFLLNRKVGDRMWTTEATLHDVGGGLAPSLADAGLWIGAAKEWGLEEGWITNGLNSSRVPRSVFPQLHQNED
jgi:hypothetical protein